MRGGTASCTVVIADHPIGSPIVDVADSVVALNPSRRWRSTRRALARAACSSSTPRSSRPTPSRADIEVVRLPCTELARAAGDDRLVSVVGLGGLVARRPIVRAVSVRAALTELVGKHHPELLDADLAAFDAGFDRARVGAAA